MGSIPDAASEADAIAAIRYAAQRGRINILCNNAAYLTEFHDALQSSSTEWSRSLDITVMGTHYFTREALPHMVNLG